MSFPVPDGEVILDGRWTAADAAVVAICDPSLQSGLGVFETLAVRGGRPIDLDEHLERLTSSARAVSVPLPAPSEIGAQVGEVAERVVGGFGWIKITALRTGRLVVFGGTMDPSEEGRPSSAVLLPWRRSALDPLAGVKSISYAAFAIGTEYARARGADEGLWRTSSGFLLEGCSSNVFVVRGRRVLTPSLREGCLAGVTRAAALRAVRELGLVLHEGKVRVERLVRADEAFLTSSLRAVRPLVRFDDRPVGRGAPGPWTRRIAESVARIRGVTGPPADGWVMDAREDGE